MLTRFGFASTHTGTGPEVWERIKGAMVWFVRSKYWRPHKLRFWQTAVFRGLMACTAEETGHAVEAQSSRTVSNGSCPGNATCRLPRALSCESRHPAVAVGAHQS